MADNRLIYQLTAGTPQSTSVVPYSAPATGDAFKGTVAELWAAGSPVQTNANIGTGNTITAGPSSSPAEGYVMGNNNRLAGCGYSFGDQNDTSGTSTEPCSMAYGRTNKAYCGGFSFGQNNIAAGTVNNAFTGYGSYTLGRDNVATGVNNVCEGYNSSVGTNLTTTLIGPNQYQLAGNYQDYFVGGYVTLVYNCTLGTKAAEVLAYNNVFYNGITNLTTFELASKSMIPTGTPQYEVYFHDCSESFSYGYGNQTRLSTSTVTVGRGNSIYGGSNTHFFGYGFYEVNPAGQTTYVGGDCNLRLKSSKIIFMQGMTATPPAAYTTSLTVDGNGNLSLQSASLTGCLLLINQTSPITINSIQNLGPLNGLTNGQTMRIVNTGTSDITLAKDNASGNSGYRLYWAKSGNNATISQNHSLTMTYIDSLALSGSTGGWLIILDGTN